MSDSATPSYLGIVDFVAGGSTPQAVVDTAPSFSNAISSATRCWASEDALSPEGKAELDHFTDPEHVLRVAKARARQILASGSRSRRRRAPSRDFASMMVSPGRPKGRSCATRHYKPHKPLESNDDRERILLVVDSPRVR